MEGTSKKAVPYVLDDDREASKSKQTVWHVKPLGGLDGARIAARYASTERIGRKGYNEIHTGKRIRADEDSWVEIVTKVENYFFSPDYPELRKQNPVTTDDPDVIKLIARDITLDQFNEIIDFSANAGRLSAVDKKKLS